MSTIIDLAVITQIISPYLTMDYLHNSEKQIAYVFDNNAMSDLAYSARENPSDFRLILEAMNVTEYDIIIPSVVLEESGGNAWMNREKYNEYYLAMFKSLSEVTNVFVVSTEDAFGILGDGYVNENEAWIEFQLIASSLNRANYSINQCIQQATTVIDIDVALQTSKEDAGERQAHLIVCSLLMNGIDTVSLISNEEKEVFALRTLFSKDETLLETMRMPSQDIFLESYLLESFDCVLCKTLKRNANWSIDVKNAFIERNRRKNNINRLPRFKLSDHTFDRRQLPNIEFVSMIHVNPSAQIIF